MCKARLLLLAFLGLFVVHPAFASGGSSGVVPDITLGTNASGANPHVTGDASTGLFTNATKHVDIAINGLQVIDWNSLGESITGTLSVSGAVTLGGLTTGTQVSCLGLDSGNHLVLSNAACGSGSGGGLTVGSTTIASGTTTKVLFDNAGVLGEYLISGTGNVAMTTNGVFTTPNLGTPSAITLTNGTGLPLAGLTGLGTGVATALANATNAASGLVGFSGALGTPTSGVATNLTGTATALNIGGNAATATALASVPTQCSGGQFATGVAASGNANCATPSGSGISLTTTGSSGAATLVGSTLNIPVYSSGAMVYPGAGIPQSTGSAWGTSITAGSGVVTALGDNVGSAGAFVVNGGALGTPSGGTATNLTGLPISTGVSGLGTGIATFLATPSSANLAAALTDETGTGASVFAGSPTLTGTVNGAAATWSSVDTALNFVATGTGADTLPVGTTGQRPGSPVAGMIRYNSTTPGIEAYYSSAWNALGGGSGGTINLGTSTSATNPQRSGEAGTGTYSANPSELDFSVAGSQQGKFTPVGLTLNAPLLPASGGSVAVVPEQYGAKGDGTIKFDGAMAGTNINNQTSSSSGTALATPSITTVTNNDLLISAFSSNTTFSSNPTPGTTRVNIAQTSGKFGTFISDQIIATAGATTPVAGTASGTTTWSAASIALKSNGSTVTFVNSTTQANATGGTTVTLAKPSGITAGDYYVACIQYGQGGGAATPVIPPTSDWQPLTYSGNNNFSDQACFGKIVGSSEPSTYVFTYAISAKSSGALLDYTNTTGPDGAATTFTSASGNFAAGDVGKPFCMAPVFSLTLGTLNRQVCTTISAVASATSISLPVAVVNNLSALQYAYGTDDSSAFNTMLTSAPCNTTGCEVDLGPKHYVLTQSYSIPANSAIQIKGIAPGIPNTANNFLNANPLANANNGTMLHFLTTNLTAPALKFAAANTISSSTAAFKVKDFTLLAGVGLGMDGGGLLTQPGVTSAVDGLDIVNWQSGFVDNVYVFNFTGLGALLTETQSGGGYIEDLVLDKFFPSYNNRGGVQIGSSGETFLESIAITNSIIETNGGPGILLAGSGIYGFTMSNDVLQWNNRYQGANAEVSTTGTVVGGSIAGNYFEIDSVLGSASNSAFGNTAGMLGLTIGQNFYYGPYTPLNFSAAGTALPSCTTSLGSATNHQTALVTDAKNCLTGQTYASGGTVSCNVTCTGGAWVENYAGAFSPGTPGTKFTTSGCSVSATTGGATSGTFTLGANSCNVIVTMNGATGLTAPNGWVCPTVDRTAPTVLIGGESSSTVTTATIAIPAGAGTTDVISFSCTPY